MRTQPDLFTAGAADGVLVAADDNRGVVGTVELIKTHEYKTSQRGLKLW